MRHGAGLPLRWCSLLAGSSADALCFQIQFPIPAAPRHGCVSRRLVRSCLLVLQRSRGPVLRPHRRNRTRPGRPRPGWGCRRTPAGSAPTTTYACSPIGGGAHAPQHDLPRGMGPLRGLSLHLPGHHHIAGPGFRSARGLLLETVQIISTCGPRTGLSNTMSQLCRCTRLSHP